MLGQSPHPGPVHSLREKGVEMMSATMALVASSRSGSEGIITMGANLRPKCHSLVECAGLSAPNSSTKAPNSSADSSSRIRTRSNSTVTTASTTSTTALWSAIGLRKRPRTSWGKPHSASATSSGNVRGPSSKKKNNHHGGEIRTRSVASLLFIKTEPLQNLGVSALSTDIVYCNDDDDDTDTCILHGHDDGDDEDDSVVDHLGRVPCLLISPATSSSSNSSCISVSSSKHGYFGNTIHGRCGLTGISDYSVSSASIMSDSCCSAALASSPKSPLSFITSEHPLWGSSYTSSITTTYVNSDESDESLSSATRSFDALPLPPPPPPPSSRLQTYDDESCIDEELSCHFLSVRQWGTGSSCDALQDQELMIGPLMEPWRILALPESDPSRAIREASENRSGIIDSQAVESDMEEEYRIDLSDFIEPKAMDGRPIPADVPGVTTLYRKLGLALDYEDVMASWPSDRGPPILGLRRREEAEEQLDLAAWEPENQVIAAAQQSLINLHNVAGKMIEIGEVGRAPVMRMAVERGPDCPGPAPEYPAVPSGPPASAASRRARVQRYHEKRRLRLFSKTIRYEVRKLNAERRPRMKGRFIKRTTVE